MLNRRIRGQLIRVKRKLWGKAWRLRSRFRSPSAREQARKYLKENQYKLVFITGSGRSGTQLLSDLLDSTGSARVLHEPNFWEDVGTMDALRRDTELAVRYWEDFRGPEVYRRWAEKPEIPFYCEINGTIRYQIPAIKRIFPGAKLLMVARDGRGVVRSVMGWPQFYGPGSRGAYALAPLSNDPYFARWPKMSRFEKICWSWNDTHELLMRAIPENNRLKLELLTSDYGYFVERFSKYIGIEISHEEWLRSVSKKSRNATKVYAFPEWDEWSEWQKKAFVRICGQTMSKLGYII